MDREEFLDEFSAEAEMLHDIAVKDLEKGIPRDVVEDVFVKYVSAFYAARTSIDPLAEKKGIFVATYASKIIDEEDLSTEVFELCDELENDKKISGK